MLDHVKLQLKISRIRLNSVLSFKVRNFKILFMLGIKLKSSFIVLILIQLLINPTSAMAHSGLAITIPDHESVLTEAPKQLRFLFKAEVTLTNVSIYTMDGENAGQQLDVMLPRDSVGQSAAVGIRVDLDIPPLEPATYTVVWRAASQEGHYIVDNFTFTVTGD